MKNQTIYRARRARRARAIDTAWNNILEAAVAYHELRMRAICAPILASADALALARAAQEDFYAACDKLQNTRLDAGILEGDMPILHLWEEEK